MWHMVSGQLWPKASGASVVLPLIFPRAIVKQETVFEPGFLLKERERETRMVASDSALSLLCGLGKVNHPAEPGEGWRWLCRRGNEIKVVQPLSLPVSLGIPRSIPGPLLHPHSVSQGLIGQLQALGT